MSDPPFAAFCPVFIMRPASFSARPSSVPPPLPAEPGRSRPEPSALLPEARGLAVTPQRDSLRRPPQAA